MNWGPQNPCPRKCKKIMGNPLFPKKRIEEYQPGGQSTEFQEATLGIPTGQFGVTFLGGWKVSKLINWAQETEAVIVTKLSSLGQCCLQARDNSRPCVNMAGTSRKKFRKISGKTLEFPSPKPYASRHLKPPEHFQNLLPLIIAGDASFFRSGSGEGFSDLIIRHRVWKGECSTLQWKWSPPSPW